MYFENVDNLNFKLLNKYLLSVGINVITKTNIDYQKDCVIINIK
jgi:hypothetical protein